jgi:hypothetical protein
MEISIPLKCGMVTLVQKNKETEENYQRRATDKVQHTNNSTAETAQ